MDGVSKVMEKRSNWPVESFPRPLGLGATVCRRWPKFRMVEAPGETFVRAVTMSFEGLMMNLLSVPG